MPNVSLLAGNHCVGMYNLTLKDATDHFLELAKSLELISIEIQTNEKYSYISFPDEYKKLRKLLGKIANIEIIHHDLPDYFQLYLMNDVPEGGYVKTIPYCY